MKTNIFAWNETFVVNLESTDIKLKPNMDLGKKFDTQRTLWLLCTLNLNYIHHPIHLRLIWVLRDFGLWLGLIKPPKICLLLLSLYSKLRYIGCNTLNASVIKNVKDMYSILILYLCCLSWGQQGQYSSWWLWRGLAEKFSTILFIGSYQVWVISPDWANVQVNGNGFTLYGNSRMYFASRPTDGFDADAYWQVRAFVLVLTQNRKKV